MGTKLCRLNVEMLHCVYSEQSSGARLEGNDHTLLLRGLESTAKMSKLEFLDSRTSSHHWKPYKESGTEGQGSMGLRWGDSQTPGHPDTTGSWRAGNGKGSKAEEPRARERRNSGSVHRRCLKA